MDRESTSIIATLAIMLLCGIPGLISLCCGAVFTLAGISPDTNYSGDLTQEMTLGLGIGGLCLGVLFVVIPIVVGYVTLRRKPDLPMVSWDEPIPPPI